MYSNPKIAGYWRNPESGLTRVRKFCSVGSSTICGGHREWKKVGAHNLSYPSMYCINPEGKGIDRYSID